MPLAKSRIEKATLSPMPTFSNDMLGNAAREMYAPKSELPAWMQGMIDDPTNLMHPMAMGSAVVKPVAKAAVKKVAKTFAESEIAKRSAEAEQALRNLSPTSQFIMDRARGVLNLVPERKSKNFLGSIGERGNVELKGIGEVDPLQVFHDEVGLRGAAPGNFRVKDGQIMWNMRPTSEQYFAVDDYLRNLGRDISGHTNWEGKPIPMPGPEDTEENIFRRMLNSVYDSPISKRR